MKRIGIIGAGSMGRYHASRWARFVMTASAVPALRDWDPDYVSMVGYR